MALPGLLLAGRMVDPNEDRPPPTAGSPCSAICQNFTRISKAPCKLSGDFQGFISKKDMDANDKRTRDAASDSK
jgi:hypothetical protein